MFKRSRSKGNIPIHRESLFWILSSVSCLLLKPPIMPSLPRVYESIMQNKANFKMGNINISTARTKAYANEQRTMSNERYPKQSQFKPNPSPKLELCSTLSEVEGPIKPNLVAAEPRAKPDSPAHNPFFRPETHVAQSLSQAKLRPQLSRNFASRLFNSLHCGRGLVFATAASAQPDASLQGIWFDTIMSSKYHCSGIDLHR